MKLRRLTFKDLVDENKKSLLMDKDAMEEIERKIEERAQKNLKASN